MKKIISIIFLFIFFVPLLTQATDNSKVFMVDVLWDKGEVSIADVNVSTGFETRSESIELMSSTRFNMKLMDADGEVISEKNFSFYFEVSIHPPLEDGASTYQETSLRKLLSFPYSDKAVVLLMFDSNNRLVDQKTIKDKVDYAKEEQKTEQCGNKKCESSENINNCPQDCQIVKQEKKNLVAKKNPISTIVIGMSLILLILITVTMFWYFKKRSSKEGEGSGFDKHN